MQHAVIDNGIIINVIVTNDFFDQSDYSSRVNCDECIRIDNIDPKPGIGWSYDGQTFTAPETEE